MTTTPDTSATTGENVEAPLTLTFDPPRTLSWWDQTVLWFNLGVSLTGPVQMPMLIFADDADKATAFAFTDAAARRGVLLHPWHNMFLSTAHTVEVIDEVLALTDSAFAETAAALRARS